MRVAAAAILPLLLACSSPPRPEGAPPAARPEAGAPVAIAPLDAGVEGAVPIAVAAPREDEPPEPSFREVAEVLFADRSDLATIDASCPSSTPAEARIRCLYDQRYRGDPKAAGLAHELLARWRIVAGVEVAHTMDGGYRGMIRIEPAVPIAAERKHLEWIVLAMRDFDAFFLALDRHDGAGEHAKRYRFRPITLRFMRSVAARTPSAYAHDWTVAWNLAGSLHTSPDAVRETLFHEIFHLNDYAHPTAGSDAWSFPALEATFDVVVKKCGTGLACLAPYTPNDTIVRGGTYYSFQPGNGVREYAAELALRYYREQRAVLRGLPAQRPEKPFKCGPPENGRAWGRMRDEFFAGVDVVPPCGTP